MGALDHLKILDFSTLLPGPYATLVLADLGAQVLKISAPDRPDLVTLWPPVVEGTETTAAAAWLGRNKKTICLNLKTPAGRRAVASLIAEYDILVEQFRPGVMDKLGLGYEALSQINPRLIYCSLTGYGQTGPMGPRAGHDINYLARSGNMAAAGRTDGGPSLTNMQIADVAVGSMNSVVGILAAVEYRHHTGLGQHIDVAMLDGLIPFHTMDGAGFLAGGDLPRREGQSLNGGGIYDFYETADGGFMSVGSLEPKFFSDLCLALGTPQWADGAILKTDLPTVKETFRTLFRTRTRDQWTAHFAGFDACVEPVLSLDEAVGDPHITQRGLVPKVPIPTAPGRTVDQLGCPVKLSRCPAQYRHAGYPDGYHTQAVLGGLGLTAEEIDQASR